MEENFKCITVMGEKVGIVRVYGVSARDASRINKLICKAGSVTGHKPETSG